MGKREDIKKKRNERDYYPTVDPIAAKILVDFIGSPFGPYFIEPCAGNGRLAYDLVKLGTDSRYLNCSKMWDIEPQNLEVWQFDCTKTTKKDINSDVEYFITNPPFQWSSLQPILDTLPLIRPTWLLLPADVMHNLRMKPYMERCSTILSVGRMYWMEDSPIKGVDNFCWYEFQSSPMTTVFYNTRGN